MGRKRRRRSNHRQVLGSSEEPLLSQIERGNSAECRLVAIITQAIAGRHKHPDWLYSADLGTVANDRQGIDVVVVTDVGPLFLQVKSSNGLCEKFEFGQHLRKVRGLRSQPVSAIVVNETKSDSQVFGEAIWRLSALRQNRLRHGRSYFDDSILTFDK